MYQVISKETGEIVCEHFSYSYLEERFRDHAHVYFIKNAKTGVEWEIPQ
jgi:hypothetical protein